MKKKINYGGQYIDKLDVNLVIKSLNKNLITTGNYVNLFEKKLEINLNVNMHIHAVMELQVYTLLI